MNKAEALRRLGLTEANFNEEELAKAYKKSKFRTHPDNKETGSDTLFKAMNEAHDFLKESLEGGYVAETKRGEMEARVKIDQLWIGTRSTIFAEGRKWSFKIPPRIPEGTLLKVVCGSTVVPVRVRVDPHEIWDIRGEHLGIEVEIPESKREISFAVPLPDGSVRTVTVGPELKSGMMVKLEGYGQCVSGGLDGALFVKVFRA